MRSIILIVALLLTGCSAQDRWAEIESDTDWSGYFENRSVDGSGSRRVDLPQEGDIVCVVVQKETEEGYLRVRIVKEGTFLAPPQETEWAETRAAYGVVDRCLD